MDCNELKVGDMFNAYDRNNKGRLARGAPFRALKILSYGVEALDSVGLLRNFDNKMKQTWRLKRIGER